MTSVATPTLRALPQHCARCGIEYEPNALAICESCLGPLEPKYPGDRRLPDRETIATRAPSMWRYREWLPFEGEPRLSQETGFTPLFEVPSLAELLVLHRPEIPPNTGNIGRTCVAVAAKLWLVKPLEFSLDEK